MSIESVVCDEKKALDFSRKKEKMKAIIIRTEKGKAKVNCEDIMYIEKYLRNIFIYTGDGQERKLLGRKTIKEIRETLDENFVQIHSGGIVNLEYVKEYSENDLILQDGKKLHVSRSRMKETKREISKYWEKQCVSNF